MNIGLKSSNEFTFSVFNIDRFVYKLFLFLNTFIIHP